MVLNVDGSSPSGHPQKEIPASQTLAGLFLFHHLKFDTDLILLDRSFDFCAISAIFSPLKTSFPLKSITALREKNIIKR